VSWSVNSPKCTFNNAAIINPTLICNDNGSYTATLTASDGVNPPVNSNAVVTVNNVVPTLGEINIPVDLNPINTVVLANASFTDAGNLDTHTALWDWGDGTTSAGTINESGGNGTASASHTYSVPGVYTVKLKITDDDAGASNVAEYQFVVIYDPTGGFALGVGVINSPDGALVSRPNFNGRGVFGFFARTRNGNLESHLRFSLPARNFHFHSNTAQWLVINGTKAQLQGTGRLEGSNHRYKFILTVIDGRATGTDKFRLQIWDLDAGNTLVYDNQMGAPNNAAPTRPIIRGNIVVR
jgi:PKD repeat protein